VSVGSAARVPARLVFLLAVTVVSAGILTVVHDAFWSPETLPVGADTRTCG
jgi:hypothetical protein